MSKTFKSNNGTNRDLSVGTFLEDIQLVIEKGQGSLGIVLSPKLAPAIALSILEAAGAPVNAANGSVVFTAGTPEHLQEIGYQLKRYTQEQEAHAKEAADRAEAEKLGRQLYNADRSACDLIWEDLTAGSKGRWIERMSKARKIIEATQ